jgi:hypothetical protein
MTERTERALIRFLLMLFRVTYGKPKPYPPEYEELENELRP